MPFTCSSIVVILLSLPLLGLDWVLGTDGLFCSKKPSCQGLYNIFSGIAWSRFGIFQRRQKWALWQLAIRGFSWVDVAGHDSRDR